MSTPFNIHRQPLYTAYLVRFWQDAPNGPWRASAQSVQTGEVVRFGTQQALYKFLENEVSNTCKQSSDLQFRSE